MGDIHAVSGSDRAQPSTEIGGKFFGQNMREKHHMDVWERD